jgi:diguanylate cyclase (GGDEF)-like protein
VDIAEPALESLDFIHTFVDLTAIAVERKKADREIYKLAYQDSLTGLYNRRHFTEKIPNKLKEAAENNKKLGLLFLDIDRFKWINDSLGHEYGDLVLIEVARRLKKFMVPNNLLSRIGGDEFILLLHIESEDELKQKVADISAAFEEPFQLDEHEIRIVPSIGISLFPEHGATAKELLKRADTAMYQSKFEGRNEYKIYQPSYDQGKENRLFMKLDLEQALSKKQFFLHYQPIINLKTGTIDSVEALVRWKHPSRGMINPNEFIPLAEESGFITLLGEWIMGEAFRQNKEWQENGLRPIRVAVNVSAKQFHHSSFVDKVTEILAANRLEPKWIELEITESVLMIDELRMISTLQQLKDLGVHISIDDFGTGYSSLNYLSSFQVNAMKVDRSFISDIPDDHDDSVITKMIISLAHNLNLEVIGEGVETLSQHQFLLQNECERAQGYFYYKPLNVQQLECLLGA